MPSRRVSITTPSEVLYNVGGDNFNRAADAARLLGIPMFNIHSAADNMVQEYLENKIKEAEPKRLQDVIDLLMTEPEYRYAAKLNDPPKIIIGDKESRCGGIIAKMTGGPPDPPGYTRSSPRPGSAPSWACTSRTVPWRPAGNAT